ncbi:hypothetical protein CO115_02575 [Candidatus Falkowbacteria bacterium CG_4_9_14_3_um_filter_36_9]|uniref:Glycosyl transferase family 1 domain-containing protein n=2 Tax=Candidatus Falkowiibacteriota TaxID=1752728 RepID=A0A1J4TB09_9BACT|nr:MAG: hypothetical protein AUJ27_00270 [Candidatus Falkowbacteria bacterium CG1_02_37_44]PIV50753.1 MAG: hypothetical protein COS18_03915 [Candidatus Falkowbacteria bacterium CG02_land_8_20_14_3_00_36_14]PIX11945.1 MAG: hypothetical protein COZ73_01375 [Candidatus Falkowbacteria bacterium CG_4_8_14_3_um_filter_36_11]PJA10542.1 MAG: hypothetical protein COX67_04380 [Candidatus Falkowbacteria bacterium CG_4_10_14_0_2_um_filter_36_22]PJB19606.1 MAG: hypothetical protein CO115_02575 [Candidatus F
MKLIYIVNAKIPTDKANGYQICKMCEEFAKAGLEVELWIPTRESRFTQDSFEYYGLERNFKIKKIKSFDFIKFHKYLGKYSFWMQSIVYLLKLIFKKVDKDTIVYSRNPEIIWLFNLKGYKTFFEVHRWSETKLYFFEIFIKKVNKVIVVTEELRKKCMEIGFSKDRIIVAPDAVDLKIFDLDISKYDARKKLNLPNNKIILGYMGSFRTMGEEKGITEILKSLKIIQKKYPNIFFLAVGGGKDDIEFYRNLTKILGVGNSILLLSKVIRSDLAIYQKACDVLLMPFPRTKHFIYYMSPLKMFEYMASKRPIIATNLPSIREVLNSSNSYLVKPNDQKDLARGIRELLQDDNFSQNISLKAFRDVQNYTWDKRVKKIIDFIKNNKLSL